MKIAVEGCAHGELEKIYNTLLDLEEKSDCKIDLLICCGDFQSTRNNDDLDCMAVPKKYQDICTFYKYYSGEKVAPVLTVFIGGNHEASNYLQELPYGGWVAPNIYYLGYAGVINVGGIRIAGLSGIFKGHDYLKGRYEHPPYTEQTKRTVYHVRNLDVFRLKQLKSPIDIMISHDWPKGIYNFGDAKQLVNRKRHFRDEIATNSLGSKANEELMFDLKPSYWFAAHLHCKFVAVVPHKDGDAVKKTTKFLALDKCLPKRQFLQMLEIPHDTNKPLELNYDLEWLTILFTTNHLINVKPSNRYMPGPGSNERWNFTPTTDEMSDVLTRMNNNLKVPLNFVRTVVPYSIYDNEETGDYDYSDVSSKKEPVQLNPQTVEFCEKLYIDDPIVLIKKINPNLNISLNCSNVSLPSVSTPDKKESTFIEDSDNSITSSCQTTIDNESSFDCITPSKINRLSLPPPKNTPTNISDDDVLEKSFEIKKNKPDAEETAVKSIKSSPKDINSTNTDSCKSELPTPSIKKFKRRNEALYTNTDDD